MSSLLKRFIGLFTGDVTSVPKSSKVLTRKDFLELQAEQGRGLFGLPEKGCQREFFSLDRHTWIWYEEWIDENKQKRNRTTRYEIHDNGIMKVQDGSQYQFLEEQELRHFAMAVRLYYERVMKNVFKRDPITGSSLR